MARTPAKAASSNQRRLNAPVFNNLISGPPQMSPATAAPAMPAAGGLATAMPSLVPGAQPAAPMQIPSYQVGGMVGPGGQPVRPAGMQPPAAPQQPMAPEMVEMQVQDLATRNPQVMAQIQQAINAALMSGELTQQELNMMVQLATTVMRNPALYPQIRQFAIQQGIATEQDLSPQYDQGLIVAILIAARAAQANVGGQNMMAGGTPAMAGTQPIQSLEKGGRVQGGDSEPVLIQAHTGEYVIPKHIVDMKGREFFERMLEQYSEKAGDD